MHSLTQHGGSSGISKIGRRRDPSYRIITGQGISKIGISLINYNQTGSVFKEVCAKEVH